MLHGCSGGAKRPEGREIFFEERKFRRGALLAREKMVQGAIGEAGK